VFEFIQSLVLQESVRPQSHTRLLKLYLVVSKAVFMDSHSNRSHLKLNFFVNYTQHFKLMQVDQTTYLPYQSVSQQSHDLLDDIVGQCSSSTTLKHYSPKKAKVLEPFYND